MITVFFTFQWRKWKVETFFSFNLLSSPSLWLYLMPLFFFLEFVIYLSSIILVLKLTFHFNVSSSPFFLMKSHKKKFPSKSGLLGKKSHVEWAQSWSSILRNQQFYPVWYHTTILVIINSIGFERNEQSYEITEH